MRVVLIGGSLRAESLNRRLMGHLASEVAARGHEVEALGGEALRLPLYEDGLPVGAEVATLQAAMANAQGLILVSPEYNAGPPGHLKNAVDWLSTLKPSPWTGRPVLLAAASPGAFGGARGLIAWRAILANLGATALPEAITVPHADQQLDGEGRPQDPRTRAAVAVALDRFLHLAARLA